MASRFYLPYLHIVAQSRFHILIRVHPLTRGGALLYPDLWLSLSFPIMFSTTTYINESLGVETIFQECLHLTPQKSLACFGYRAVGRVAVP